MLDVGLGMSTENDGHIAGKKTVQEALDSISVKPKLAILAIDSLARKKPDHKKILNSIREELDPEVPLIGSTVNGIVINKRFALKSVGLMLLGGDLSVDSSFNYTNTRTEYEAIAEKLYKNSINLEPNDTRFMFMFQDGHKFPPEMMSKTTLLNARVVSFLSGLVNKVFKSMLGGFSEKGIGFHTVQELITSLYAKGWSDPIVGNVVTNVRDYDSIEFYNGKILNDGLVGAIISGKNNTKFGFGFGAGAESTGNICKITKNIGSFLLRIDGKPALLGFCDAAGLNKDALSELKATGYTNIYNIIGTTQTIEGKKYIHLQGTITDPNLENLILTGFPFTDVPEEVEIFRSNMKILHETTIKSVNEALVGISNPKFYLGIDCAMRFVAYGDNLPKIIDTIDDTLGKDIPKMLVGSGGEIYGRSNFDHYNNNFTMISLIGGE